MRLHWLAVRRTLAVASFGDGLDEDAALARIRAQADRSERLAAADVVWTNDGTPENLREQVRRWWRETATDPSVTESRP